MEKHTFFLKPSTFIGFIKTFCIFTILFSLAHLASSQCSTSKIPDSDCSFDYVIDSFTFNGKIANTTGCSGTQTGYTNFGSTHSFEAFPGSIVNVSATLGNHYNKMGLAVWIDFNNDGFFESNEYVFNAAPDTSVSGTITIPSSAISTTVKMRIMSTSQTPSSNDACLGRSFYGETEDYDLLIKPISKNNAAVWAVDSPSFFCAGTHDIYATIGNAGINQIDSVEIHWEFNGVLQPIVKYIQLLDTVGGTNPTKAQVFLDTKSFAFGTSNQIKIWSSLPNGAVDPFNIDDTLHVNKKPALTGNYTIDPSLPNSSSNYQSFSTLAYDLNNYGICGPVNVIVSSATYQDYFYLKNVIGTSAINTIIIDGQDSSTNILSHNGLLVYATVTLDNTDYVTIKNMSIEGTNANWGASLLLNNGAQHNTITNSVLKVDTSHTSFDKTNIKIVGNATSYNILSNNLINGGACALLMDVIGNTVNVNNQILNNEMFNIYAKGIMAFGQDSLEIKENYIDVYSRGFMYGNGVEILASNNTIFSKNYIHSVALGLRVDNYQTFSVPKRNIEISNNIIITDNDGLGISDVDSIDIFHNSISVNGIGPAMNIISYMSTVSNYDMRNNILSSLHGSAFTTNQSASIFSKMDHNIYYSVDGAVLLSVAMSDYADLSSFKNAAPSYNISSHEGNPQFVSPSNDLHILGTLANDKGDNSVGILQDFDGDIRPLSAVNVDIGADEYTPPSCPPLYGMKAFSPGLDSISLYWNAGSGGHYQYEILTKGNAHGTGTIDTTLFNSLRIGNLIAATAYEFYVRNICSRGDTSIWWGPHEFYTANELPYLEDFESFNSSSLNNGWKTNTYVAPEWKSASVTPYGAVIKDHTIGTGGTFAYLNSSYAPGQSTLTSPLIYVDTNERILEFSFWYFMNGGAMGDLNVYILANGKSTLITTISGSQQTSETDPWLEFSTYLTAYAGESIQIQFEATKSFGANSEMAIDDVFLDTISAFDAGIVGINPVSSVDSCYSSTQNVEALLINNGNAAIDFSVDTAQVYVNVSGTASQNYFKIIDDNSLNNGIALQIGDSLIVPMGNLNMTGIGTYEFESFLSIGRDLIHVNDTLLTSIEHYKASTGTVFGSDTICGNDTVTLSSNGTFGELQWQRLVAGAFLDETAANSTSYEVFIDSTTHFRLLACSTEISDTLTVLANPIPASPNTVSDTVIVFCGDSGTAVLTASSNLANAYFYWYKDSTSTSVFATGDTLYYGLNTAGQISQIVTDTLYVSVVDSISGCESKKSMVFGTSDCIMGGMELSDEIGSISIYPNPSKGLFNLLGNNIEADLQVSIYNSNGKLIFQRKNKYSNDFIEKLDLSGLSKGIYFIKFQADKFLELKKVVIQ